MPSEGFVRQKVLLNILGISDATLWRRIKDGSYPKPVKLGPNTTAWRVNDIRALIRSFDESDGTETPEAKNIESINEQKNSDMVKEHKNKEKRIDIDDNPILLELSGLPLFAR